jgi:hypothetical protein
MEDLEYSIAIATDDIIKTVSQLRARGVEFYQRLHALSSNSRRLGDTWVMMKRYQ